MMLDTWVLSKIDALRDERIILLRDPQRMIQRGARAVDGWGEENGFTVIFCSGNLALREHLRTILPDPEARLLLVDITREDGKLFYPDLEVKASPQARLKITLHDFLVEKTGDVNWPKLVNDRNLADLLLPRLPEVLKVHGFLRHISSNRFTDSDLYKIVIGTVLEINPFQNPSPNEIRRICLNQHDKLTQLDEVLSEGNQQYIDDLIRRAPEPFCWLRERDPELILRAFTLSAILHQHGLDHGLLLTNIDPDLHPYRNISTKVLDDAMRDQVSADPEQVLADVKKVEEFLEEKKDRLVFLLAEQLHVEDFEGAVKILKNERLSERIRSLALASLLFDLVQTMHFKKHAAVLAELEKQELQADFPVLRRPSEQWQQLLNAYRRAISVYQLLKTLNDEIPALQAADGEGLSFDHFDKLWNKEKLNRLDYYLSDLERILRVGEILPLAKGSLWQSYLDKQEAANTKFKETMGAVGKIMRAINIKFQDLYNKNYTKWILQPDSPVIFTHQFLDRMLKAYWDPKSGRKVVILVFDGMRTDAWDEFLRPVLEEKYAMVASQPGSAIIPTETELSRKAISAGALPKDFPISSRQELALLKEWLKTNMGLKPEFSVVCDDESKSSGLTVRYNSDLLDYIIFNFTDDNLHNNPQDLAFIYNQTVKEIIRQDVRALLRDLPPDALIFITADHGFTAMPEKIYEATVYLDDEVVPDRALVKYSSARASAKPAESLMKKIVSFDINLLKIPIPNGGGDPVKFVFFPRPGMMFMREPNGRAPDKYGHGGVSLAECMVPMVVMGPKPKANGIIYLDRIAQVGSMLENEPLVLDITIKCRQLFTDSLTFTLNFSEDGISDRKEIFNGSQKVVQISWKPEFSEVSDSDRDRGYMEFPLTVTLSHRDKEKEYKESKSINLRMRIDTSRLRRRLDTKLDLMMGKLPKDING